MAQAFDAGLADQREDADGQQRDLWYVVQWGLGFAGSGYKIDFCISGLDPWHVYGADCRSLR